MNLCSGELAKVLCVLILAPNQTNEAGVAKCASVQTAGGGSTAAFTPLRRRSGTAAASGSGPRCTTGAAGAAGAADRLAFPEVTTDV